MTTQYDAPSERRTGKVDMTPADAELALRVGRRLASLRRGDGRPGMRQDELAAKAGVSPSYVSMVERGERLPHLPTLARLAVAVGTDVAFLVEQSEVDVEAALRPLINFCRARRLGPEQVDRLLAMARVMFSRPEVGP